MAQARHPDMALWRQCILHWFPRLHERAYFVPPVYMNRVQYLSAQFAGIDVDITQPPVVNLPRGGTPVLQVSQVREDQTQQHVLYNLQSLAEVQQEVMFVISQLQFGDYLGNPCYAAAASKLRRPVDLIKQQKHRGDFDLLILHKHYGLVVAEIKSVGDKFQELSMSEQQQDDVVSDRVNNACKQLGKAYDVLTYVISDQQRPPPVRKALIVPNITRAQLQRVLCNRPQVRQDLCLCLDISCTADPADLCLTADDVSDRTTPSDITNDVRSRLFAWWIRRVAGPFISPSDDTYEHIVSRFTGPATTVQVFCCSKPPLYLKSEGEGVLETSRRFTRDIVLHPHQLDLLNRNEPLVYICGPPGTGKTVLLVVRGRDWLRRGWHVHVVSTWKRSVAVSHLLVRQLQETEQEIKQTTGNVGQLVHHHMFDLMKKGQEEPSVQCLEAFAKHGPLCVLMDEPCDGRSAIEFCTELCTRVPGIHLWVANLYHKFRPPCLTEVPVTEPLRTPPAITREVQKAPVIELKAVRSYTFGPAPLPSDGPPLRVLYHKGDEHAAGASPISCEQCGKNLAEELKRLHVNIPGPVIPTATGTSAAVPPSKKGKGQSGAPFTPANIPAPLTYRDVFLLTVSGKFEEEEKDDAGNSVTAASGVVRGLRSCGVPVRVVSDDDPSASRDVALMAGPEEIVAAPAFTVTGLERAIVVWIQAEGSILSQDVNLSALWVMSRTTSQYISIVLPPEPAPHDFASAPFGGGDDDDDGDDDEEKRKKKDLQRDMNAALYKMMSEVKNLPLSALREMSRPIQP